MKQLFTLILFVAVGFIGCKKDNFLQVDGVCPAILSTNPIAGATNVPSNQVITVTFNEEMNPSSITNETFFITGSVVPGTITYSGVTATFVPLAPLIANHTYTGTVTTGVKDLKGNALQQNYVWAFSTGTVVSPMVVSTDPVNLASAVVLNKEISATFNMPMNAVSLNDSNFYIKQGTTKITGTISYNANTVNFKPSVNLTSGTTYTATVTKGARSMAGAQMPTDYVWSFTTGAQIAPTVISTIPLNGAVNVGLNATVNATFSTIMDQTSLDGSSFTLFQGAIKVPGAVSGSGASVTFTPSANLVSGKMYTATITTGAKNVAGTAMANNYVWTFNTLTLAPPTVILTDPSNSSTGVALNKAVNATFSTNMDQTTLNGTTFTLYQGASKITGTVSGTGATTTFTPTANLVSGKTYTATITNAAKDLSGTAMTSNYVWTFSTLGLTPPTVISTDPLNSATNVALNKAVKATFSTNMDQTTLNGTSFTLYQGGTPVAGTVSGSGATATFTPTTFLISGKTYTATISTLAKDLSGTALASNYVWTFSTKAHTGPNPPDLQSAEDFGILAYSTVTNNAGVSQINNMNVGVYPGTAFSGFPPGKVNNGAMYKADDPSPIPALLIQAKADLTTAYLFCESASSPAPTTVSGNQGGTTLYPGIYKSTSTLSVNGSDLTLDAQGDVNAVWIFQIASTLITTTGGNIVLSGGAQAKNIYWQVGSAATIGDYTSFYGNILALTSITMNSYSTATGRMLTQNAAVTLTSTNTINKP